MKGDISKINIDDWSLYNWRCYTALSQVWEGWRLIMKIGLDFSINLISSTANFFFFFSLLVSAFASFHHPAIAQIEYMQGPSNIKTRMNSTTVGQNRGWSTGKRKTHVQIPKEHLQESCMGGLCVFCLLI